MNKAALALTIIGAVLLILSFGLVAVTGLLTATSGGKISPDESAPVFLGGGCCCTFSFVMLAGGVIWMLAARK